MKLFRKSIIITLSFALLFMLTAPIAAMASAGPADSGVIEHSHYDNNNDGECDVAGCSHVIVIYCNDHNDIDGDGKCDNKKSTDDDSACGACTDHNDEDGDCICDSEDCEAEVAAENTIGTEKWTENLLDSLKFMGLGMLGIFIVTGIIILIIYALNNATNKNKDN